MNFKKQYFLLRDKANGEVTILISFMGSFLKLVFMTIKPKLNNWTIHCKKHKEQSMGERAGMKMLREKRSEVQIIFLLKEAFSQELVWHLGSKTATAMAISNSPCFKKKKKKSRDGIKNIRAKATKQLKPCPFVSWHEIHIFFSNCHTLVRGYHAITAWRQNKIRYTICSWDMSEWVISFCSQIWNCSLWLHL